MKERPDPGVRLAVAASRARGRRAALGLLNACLLCCLLLLGLTVGCADSSGDSATLMADTVPALNATPSPTTVSTPPTTLPSWLIKQRLAEAELAEREQATRAREAATGTSAPPVLPAAAASPGSSTSLVLTNGGTPLKGIWSGTAERLAAFLLSESPQPGFTVPALTLAGHYTRYCSEAGLRADLLWAQMLHETGYGRYGGAVAPAQNNYAGIGATGGSEPGLTFASAEAGVKAHVAHMVAYVYTSSPVAWAGAASDPRFDRVWPRGAAAVLKDLDGRWAVPGEGYGRRIEDIARAINSR